MTRVVYDGSDITSVLAPVGVYVESIERGLGVSPDNVSVRRSGSDGSRFVRTSLPSRTITIGIAISAPTNIDARLAEEQLIAKLFRSEPRDLEFSDQMGAYRAVLDSVAVASPSQSLSKGSITFLCPDPFRYGQPRVVAGTGSVVGHTNWYVEPVWTVQPPNNSNPVKLSVDGVEIEIAATIPSAGVTFDSSRRETRVGGTLKVIEVSGEYPVLKENSVISVVPVGSTITGAYTERWL